MSGNSFGKLLTITTFGESHGSAIGVVIDGMIPGLNVSLEDLQKCLNKRRPGRLKETTSRNETDYAQILSGVFEGKTLGTPISVIIKNEDQQSQDYDKLKDQYRPGHADKTTLDKYGIRDHRGGGRASGRETAARVIAGYFASLIIPSIIFEAKITQIAHHKYIINNPGSSLGLLDSSLDEQASNFLLKCKTNGESCGGKVRLVISNMPKGLGEPVFDKLKADLAKAFLSIGSCTGFHYGLGEDFAHKLGSEISTNTSAFGGIEGGISNGEDISIDLTFKAPSTNGDKAKEGRHDPCILPRVLVVVESMATLVIADHFLRQKSIS